MDSRFQRIIIVYRKSGIGRSLKNRAELDQYLNNEPYILESVWERVEVQPMNVVILDGEEIMSITLNLRYT